MIFILLRPIEGAKFAVNVTDVGIINIPIDDIGHDFRSATTVAFCFCQMPSTVREGAKFIEWPSI